MQANVQLSLKTSFVQTRHK